ncbi:MAG: hypothetical protein AUK39_02650 [Dehalococcoidia bacterium CG2_30_46_19]|nr:MAG: hypothetical protein AUK39_02650 [Dehalococcoidia bacterium CG2_30_46_19]
MDRKEILEKKLETLEELEKIGEKQQDEESEKSTDIMSLYIPRPPRAAMESAMERLRKMVYPF